MKSRGVLARLQRQILFRISMKPRYLPERYSVDFLALTDRQGFDLALYGSDYFKLKAYLHHANINDFAALTVQQKHAMLVQAGVRVVRYYSSGSALNDFELDAQASRFDMQGDIRCLNGTTMKKYRHQNCFVIINNKLYLHPKVRPVAGQIAAELVEGPSPTSMKMGVIGVNHSSLSNGKVVNFAGSFTHERGRGWLIENATGHYGTSAHQMRIALETLDRYSVDLSQLTVRLWVPLDPKQQNLNETDFTVDYENAQAMLSRMKKNNHASSLCLFNKTTRRQKCVAALQNGQIDSATYILLSMALLQQDISSFAFQHIARSFARNHHQHAIEDIINLCQQAAALQRPHITRVIVAARDRIEDSPLNGECRRYFETKLAKEMLAGFSLELYASLHVFADFVVNIAAGTDLVFPAKINNPDNLHVLFECMRKLADVNSGVLARHDRLRAQSNRYARKDRGVSRLAPGSSASVLSMNPGILKNRMPVPADVLDDVPKRNRTPDVFGLDDSKAATGYSAQQPDVPFVNSISGTTYTLVVLLEDFVADHHADARLQETVNYIVQAWVAVMVMHGYHSIKEVSDVLRDPVVVSRFEPYGVVLTFVLNDEVLQKVTQQSADYACTFSLRATVQRSVVLDSGVSSS